MHLRQHRKPIQYTKCWKKRLQRHLRRQDRHRDEGLSRLHARKQLAHGEGRLAPALDLARPQAVVNLFAGFPRGGAPVPFDPNLVHYSEVLLTGSQNATADQYRRTLRLLRTTPHIDEVVTNRYTVETSPEAYTARLAMNGLKSLVQFAGVDPA